MADTGPTKILLLLLLFCSVCGVVSQNNATCDSLSSSLKRYKIPFAKNSKIVNGSSELCGEGCCGYEVDIGFRARVEADLTAFVQSVSMNLADVLAANTKLLRTSVVGILNRAEEATMARLRSSYPHFGNRNQTVNAVRSCFDKLKKLLAVEYSDSSRAAGDWKYGRLVRLVADAVRELFANLFPSVFNCIAVVDYCYSAPQSYVQCLQRNAIDLEPFGRDADEISKGVADVIVNYRTSIEAVDTLHQAVLLFQQTAVTPNIIAEFVRLKYCTLCKSSSNTSSNVSEVKPCRMFCLAVFSETFDVPWKTNWDDLLISFATLGGKLRNIRESALTNLDRKIVAAITASVEKRMAKVAVDVVSRCGAFKNVNSLKTSGKTTVIKKTRRKKGRQVVRSTGQLSVVFPTIRETGMKLKSSYVGLFSRLLERICVDSETSNQNCWNGREISSLSDSALAEAKPSRAADDDKHSSALTEDAAKHAKMAETMKKIQKVVDSGHKKEGRSDRTAAHDSHWGPLLEESDDEDFGGSGSGDGDGFLPEADLGLQPPYQTLPKTDRFGTLDLTPVVPNPKKPISDNDYVTHDVHPDDKIETAKPPSKAAAGQLVRTNNVCSWILGTVSVCCCLLRHFLIDTNRWIRL